MTDTELIDLMADNRICDQVGKYDIDDMTSRALPLRLCRAVRADELERVWRIEWRRQFRRAVERTWGGGQ